MERDHDWTRPFHDWIDARNRFLVMSQIDCPNDLLNRNRTGPHKEEFESTPDYLFSFVLFVFFVVTRFLLFLLS